MMDIVGGYIILRSCPLQRKGYGKQLLAAAEAWLKEQGAPKIRLMVRKSNEAVRQFMRLLAMKRVMCGCWGRICDEHVFLRAC
jgi:RimJ/RimL family protein N-acetyltransferase